jgi:SpoIID/LytB domain protein
LGSIKEKDWLSFLYLGLAHEDLNQKSLAVNSYLRSLKLKRNSISLYRLGKIYYRKKQYHKAAQFFYEVISLDSSIRLANLYLGECLSKTGKYKDAYSYFAKGVKFYPQNLQIKKKLAEVKTKLGEDFFLELKRVLEATRKTVKLMFYTREENIPLIKVGLAKDIDKFTFRCGGDFILSDGKETLKGIKDNFYTIAFKDKKLLFSDGEKGITPKEFMSPLEIRCNNQPFYILDLVYGKGNFWHKEIDRVYRGDLKVAVDNKITLINVVSIEEYLYGVLAAEISSNAEPEALRAQAIAARTLAYSRIGQRHKNEGFDVCSDVHCQVYQGLSIETVQTTQSVKDTRGEILIYKEKPIDCFYHSNCGGCLREDAFTGKSEYLATKFDATQNSLTAKDYSQESSYKEELWFFSEPDTFCSSSKSDFRWQRVYDKEDFLLVFGFPLESIKAITPREKGDCFHYKTIEVITDKGKTELRGDLNIRDYFDKLRSSAFKLEIKFSSNEESEILFFWGAGFGHGGGLCQDGAETMAKKGYNYEEILKHYYPGANLKKLY